MKGAVLFLVVCAGVAEANFLEFLSELPAGISKSCSDAWRSFKSVVNKPVRIKRLGSGGRRKPVYVPTTNATATTKRWSPSTSESPELAYKPAPEQAYKPTPESGYKPAPERAYKPMPKRAHTLTLEPAPTPAPEWAHKPTRAHLILPVLDWPRWRTQERWARRMPHPMTGV